VVVAGATAATATVEEATAATGETVTAVVAEEVATAAVGSNCSCSGLSVRDRHLAGMLWR
jgi:hypothetical protein